MADRDRITSQFDDEKVVVTVPEGLAGDEFYEAAAAAGWSDDPGTGKSIYISDRSHPEYGKEIPNPTPMAPPIGYSAEDTLEDMVRRHMQKQFNLMAADEVLDESAKEADDFEIDDELPDLRSLYEVQEMEPEVPDLGRQMSDAVFDALERQRAAQAPPSGGEKEGA